jgi:hypothetical protein
MTPPIHPPGPTQPFDVPPTVTTGADATVRVEAESDLRRAIAELVDALFYYVYPAEPAYSGGKVCPRCGIAWPTETELIEDAAHLHRCPYPRHRALQLKYTIDPTSTPAERTHTDES